MELRVISAADVEAVLPMGECVEIMARALETQGITSMLDHLGENVKSPEQALAAREAYLAGLAAIAGSQGLQAAISVKLTQLGLDESIEACWANLEPILAAAEPAGTLVMIDMESHVYVDRTLEVLRLAHARWPGPG